MRSMSIFLPVYMPATNIGSTPAAFSQKLVKAFEAFARDRAVFMVRSEAHQMLGFDPGTQHPPALRRYDIVTTDAEDRTADVVASEILARAIVDFMGKDGSVMTLSAGRYAAINMETTALMELGEDPWAE